MVEQMLELVTRENEVKYNNTQQETTGKSREGQRITDREVWGTHHDESRDQKAAV